jgi:LuxR family transcriptional regulator, maltose regulon positive regulatory protein
MVESHSALRYLVPRHAVDRPRLIDRMDEALTVPLTVVVAAPGAGKSLLLRQWAAEHPSLHYLWLGVEVADDDPVRFGRRLIDGLAAIDSDMADLVALISLHGPGLGTPLLETLTAQLADLPEVVIILDDLHHLSNAALFADLEHLVEVLLPMSTWSSPAGWIFRSPGTDIGSAIASSRFARQNSPSMMVSPPSCCNI